MNSFTSPQSAIVLQIDNPSVEIKQTYVLKVGDEFAANYPIGIPLLSSVTMLMSDGSVNRVSNLDNAILSVEKLQSGNQQIGEIQLTEFMAGANVTVEDANALQITNMSIAKNADENNVLLTINSQAKINLNSYVGISLSQNGTNNELLVPINEHSIEKNNRTFDLAVNASTLQLNEGFEVQAALNAPVSRAAAESNRIIHSPTKVLPEVPVIMSPEAANGGVNKVEWQDGIDLKIQLPKHTTMRGTVYISVMDSDGKLVESAEYTVKPGESAGDVVNVKLPNLQFLHEESYFISAYVVNTTGFVSDPSEPFEFYVDLVAPGEGEGEDGENISPDIDLIEISPATGDTYINSADFTNDDDGNFVPFTATIPLGSNAGDILRVYINPVDAGVPIYAEYSLSQSAVDAGFIQVDLSAELLNTSTLDGQYVLTASVLDVVGNESAISQPITFTFDITAPSAARFNIIDDVHTQEIIVENGDYSNDVLPIINGFGAEGGASIEIFDTNNNSIGTVTADIDGNWQYQLTDALDEGSHQFTTIQTDRAGNLGERSEPFSINIDITPPGATGGKHGEPDGKGNVINFIENDEYINDSEAVNVTLSGAIENNARVVAIVITDGINNVEVANSDISIVNGIVAVNNIDVSALNDGAITVSMTVEDQARNVGDVSDSITKHPTDHTIGPVEDVDGRLNQIALNSITDTSTGIVARAEDHDGDAVSYHLQNTLGGLLKIDPVTGEVFIDDASLIGDKGDIHQAHVFAISSDGSSSSASFDITVSGNAIGPVIDVDNDTEFSRQNLVSENAPIGTPVGIKAEAAEDPEDTVAYALAGVGGLFAIDSSTGIVTTAGNLDYETATSHDIIVIATSSDGSTSTNTFTINVGDNEYGAGGEGSRGDTDHGVKNLRDIEPRENTVKENSDAETLVGINVLAEDIDGDTVSYRLSQDSEDAGIFSIDSLTGVITVVGEIDYETNAYFDVGVIAESYDKSTTTNTFRIAVEDVNEAPIFTQVSGSVAIEMTATVGDVVGRFVATDPEDDGISYRIESGNELGFVEIDEATGNVTLTQAGYDALHDNAGNITTIELNVVASDGALESEATTSITLDEMLDPTIDLKISSDSGESNSDHITSISRPWIVGTGEAGATIELMIGTDIIGTGTIASNGKYSIRVNTLDQGTHDVTVIARDPGGNVEDSSMSLTIDSEGVGSISIDSITTNNIIDKTEINDQIDITGTVDGEFDAGDVVSASINGHLYQGSVNSDGSTWLIENVVAADLLADTMFSVSASGSDIAGNRISSVQQTTHQAYANEAPIAIDDIGVFRTGQQLERDTFGSSLEGWSGGRRVSNSLQVARQATATKVFDFGEEHAGQTVILSYTARGTRKWEMSGDRIIGTFNDVVVNNKHPDGKSIATRNLEVTLDEHGRLVASFRAGTNAKNEKAYIDNFTVVGGDDFQTVISTQENDSLIINVLNNDSDPDGDAIRITKIDGVDVIDGGDSVSIRDDRGRIVGQLTLENGKIKFTPSSVLDGMREGEVLALEFDYDITDDFGGNDNAIVAFNVIGTNDKPIIELLETEFDENAREIVIGHISDIDGDLSIGNSSVTAKNGTVFIDTDGDIVYTPNTNYDGEDTVTVIARDEANAQVRKEITLTIRNINNKPTIADDILPDTGTNESKTVTINVLANDNDLDGDPLTITHIDDFLVSGSDPIVIRQNGENIGEAWVDNDQIKFKAYGVLAEGEKATYNFTYRASDGEESGKAKVEFTLTGVNDAPVITQTLFNVEEDSAANVIGHINDIDGEIDLDATNSQSSNGVVTIMSNGNILYSPNEDFFGRDSIEIVAVDNDGKITRKTLQVDVANVNDRIGAIADFDIQANTILAQAADDTFVGITALAYDADPSDKVTYRLSDSDISDGIFAIDKNTGKVSLLDGSLINVQIDTTLDIHVIATSNDGSTSTETFDISVIAGPSVELAIEGIADGGMALSSTDDEVRISGTVEHTIDGGRGDDTIHLNMSKEIGRAHV